jgi:hypothetical protein
MTVLVFVRTQNPSGLSAQLLQTLACHLSKRKRADDLALSRQKRKNAADAVRAGGVR